MPSTNAATEKRIATTAREIAKLMGKLRKAGDYAGAERLLRAGQETVAEMRTGRL